MLNIIPVAPYEEALLIPHVPVLIAYRGSIAHNMHTPHTDGGIDDIDLIVVYIPDLVNYFGVSRAPARGHDRKIREWDVAAYELRHFVHLLSQANPNVLAALWLKPEMYLRLERAGRALIEHRRAFLSKRVYHSFVGYAHGQLKRMTAYHERGENECCSGEEFHAEDCKLREERGRGSIKKYATGFMGAKRKALVEQFGFDAKNAAHCIRLLRMGCELMRTGELVVDRRDAGDADELLSIKRGEWPLAKIQAEAQRLFDSMRDLNDSGPLPDEPDWRAIEDLLVAQLSHWFSGCVVLESQAVNVAGM